MRPGEIELRAGDDAVVVHPEAGGRLGSWRPGGVERLIGHPGDGALEGITALLWGCYLMAPWPGRLANGRARWNGGEIAVAPNREPHAIHGVTFTREWEVLEVSGDSVAMRRPLGPDWPPGGEARQRLQLTPGQLEFHAEVEAGERRMPAALGWHPWFRRDAGGDDVAVDLAAAGTLQTSPDLIPTGAVEPITEETTLSLERPIGDRLLDHVYAGAGGPAVVRWPDLELTIETSPALKTFVVHSTPTGLCVEPQTAWPDAFNLAARGSSETGSVELGPRERLEATVIWRWAGR
jgi:aldose 1-epimerase